MTTDQNKSLESALRKAIVERINEIAEEEVVEASKRIATRVMADTSNLAVEVLKRMSWDGTGEITFRISGGKPYPSRQE